MLRRGPNGTDLHTLFVAGTLPIGGGYSGREFTVEAWKESLIQRLGAGDLPSLTQALGALSPDDQADLLNDMELMTAVRDELRLDAATGAHDARIIREGTAPGETYDVYQRLGWLNAYIPIADANLLTGLGEAQRAYAEAYYTALTGEEFEAGEAYELRLMVWFFEHSNDVLDDSGPRPA